jgi:hypothetical protein
MNFEDSRKVSLIRYENPDSPGLDRSMNDFLLPQRVDVLTSPSPSRIILKLRNLGLRVSSQLNGALPTSKIMVLPLFILSCLIYVISGIKFSFNIGVGKSSASAGLRNAIKIGYFQYTPNARVISELRNLKLKKCSAALNQMLQMYADTTFLAVHVRLGDYLSDRSIGVLDDEYFNSAIEVSQSISLHETILVFSNDTSKARKLVKVSKDIELVFVNEDLLTTSETFELMRHAGSYVISNSTYSWWAAMLSYRPNPSVICPEPWFNELPEPVGLIPENWIRVGRKDG